MEMTYDYKTRDAIIEEAFNLFLKLHNGNSSLAYASLSGGLIAVASVEQAGQVLGVAKGMCNETN